ncbi:MAG: hypothetical protein ABIH23_10100 [bacterium]
MTGAQNRELQYDTSERLTRPIDLYAKCATCGHRLIDHHLDSGCDWLQGYKFCKCDGFKLKEVK